MAKVRYLYKGIEREGELVLELSRETVDTYYNEHPDERRKLEASGALPKH